jgi:hypothetical protein
MRQFVRCAVDLVDEQKSKPLQFVIICQSRCDPQGLGKVLVCLVGDGRVTGPGWM